MFKHFRSRLDQRLGKLDQSRSSTHVSLASADKDAFLAKTKEKLLAVFDTIDFGHRQGHFADFIKDGNHHQVERTLLEKPEKVWNYVYSEYIKNARDKGLSTEKEVIDGLTLLALSDKATEYGADMADPSV